MTGALLYYYSQCNRGPANGPRVTHIRNCWAVRSLNPFILFNVLFFEVVKKTAENWRIVAPYHVTTFCPLAVIWLSHIQHVDLQHVQWELHRSKTMRGNWDIHLTWRLCRVAQVKINKSHCLYKYIFYMTYICVMFSQLMPKCKHWGFANQQSFLWSE